MNEEITRINKEVRELEREMKVDFEKSMERIKNEADEFDEKSIRNFTSWRDYLYKYYFLVLTFITGTGIFARDYISEPLVVLGILLTLDGIIIGFVIINICFFLERKWIQISNYLMSGGMDKLFDHPDAYGDYRLAAILNLKDKNKEYRKRIKSLETQKDEIAEIKLKIKGNKSTIRLLRYAGEQFGFIERVWIYGVISSITAISVGMFLVFFGFLK